LAHLNDFGESSAHLARRSGWRQKAAIFDGKWRFSGGERALDLRDIGQCMRICNIPPEDWAKCRKLF
jgi:hypothetical protein